MSRLNRFFINTLATAAIASAPLMAQAGSLTVVNNTDHDSTTITNSHKPNPMCSANLPGGKGITRAHTTNVIPENTVNIACIKDKQNCKADVYMTNNCSGPMIATVIFDIKSGIKSVTMLNDKYNISGSGFYITIDSV